MAKLLGRKGGSGVGAKVDGANAMSGGKRGRKFKWVEYVENQDRNDKNDTSELPSPSLMTQSNQQRETRNHSLLLPCPSPPHPLPPPNLKNDPLWKRFLIHSLKNWYSQYLYMPYNAKCELEKI
eukprot:9312858-Ditylum_brightwellii.AAC.1